MALLATTGGAAAALCADRWQSADELIPVLEATLTPSGGTAPAATVTP